MEGGGEGEGGSILTFSLLHLKQGGINAHAKAPCDLAFGLRAHIDLGD